MEIASVFIFSVLPTLLTGSEKLHKYVYFKIEKLLKYLPSTSLGLCFLLPTIVTNTECKKSARMKRFRAILSHQAVFPEKTKKFLEFILIIFFPCDLVSKRS